MVQSPAGKVYLFGTIHLMRPDVQWHSRELDAAIAESQDLYEEIADLNNPSAGATAIAKIGFDAGHPLSTKISKADVALLDAAARRYGLPGEASFEPMKPWLAFMTLSVLPALRGGAGASTGIDLQLRKMFADAKKPVLGFETFDMQAHIFADMPQTMQVALLEQTLKDVNAPKTGASFDTMVNTWLSGDDDKIAAQFGDADQKTPLYAALLTNRNKAWAAALADRLKKPGTSFVAVGAAHLAGPGGVPALLQQMGFTVTRVQIAQTTPLPATPLPSATPSAAASATPIPTPTAAPTPIPRTIVPPAGWIARNMPTTSGAMVTDMLYAKPLVGAIVTGHVNLPAGTPMDLATFDVYFHQGLASGAGVKSAAADKKVKICSGKQDGMYAKVTINSQGTTLKEDIVYTLSDRAYLAEYVRAAGAKDDPAALKSILSLCAP